MQLTENYDSYIAASGDEPGAAIFMSVFFIKIGLVYKYRNACIDISK